MKTQCKEMNELLKEIQKNTVLRNKTNQNMKIKIQALKKIQTERILEKIKLKYEEEY